MNGNNGELGEVHHYDEIFPPLGNENDINFGIAPTNHASSSSYVNPIKKTKASIVGTGVYDKNSNNPLQAKIKLPPKVRPGDDIGFGTRKIHNGGNSDKNVYFVISFDDRKYKEPLKTSDDKSSAQRVAIQKIAARFNVSIDSQINKDKSLGLTIMGKNPEFVSQAKQALYNDLMLQSNLKVSIPHEFHRFLIGHKGEKLREIESKTGTKILIPRIGEKQEDCDTIIITGSRNLTEAARDELIGIYNDQSKRFQDRINIPKIYYPFIYGPDNRYIDELRNRCGVRITFPPPNALDDVVTVVGEKDAVAITINELRQKLRDITKDCSTLPFKLAKSQHQYVAGYKNSGINEILEATGVSVEIPPADSPSDDIILRGSTSQLGPALTLVIRRAESMKQTQLTCPNWQHRYLSGRNRSNIERIIGDLTQVYVNFHPTDDIISVEGPREDVDFVADQLTREIIDLRARLTFDEIHNVNPSMNKHIVGKGGENISKMQRDFDVSIKLDNGSIHIEGPPEGVAQAKLSIQLLLSKMENETQRDVLIDQRYHRQLIGAQGRGVRELRDIYPNVMINFPNMNSNSNIVQLRGPRQDVDEVARELETRLSTLCNMEEFTVPIPAGLHAALVTGDNALILQSIQCECGGGVILTPHSSRHEVNLRGPREDMADAKQLLLELANDKDALSFKDTVNCRPDLHKLLMGRNGALLRELRQKYGTRVTLPFTGGSAGSVDSTLITLFGKKDSVLKAKAHLQNQISELESIEERIITINQKWQSHFTQRRAQLINDISTEFGNILISFPSRNQPSDSVRIKGPRKFIELACARLMEIVEDLESQITIDLDIPVVHHRALIGQSGQNVREIQDQYHVTIKFPSQAGSDRTGYYNAPQGTDYDNSASAEFGSSGGFGTTDQSTYGFDYDGSSSYENAIQISGRPENCEQAKQAILAMVPVELEFPLSHEYHGLLIGPKGQEIARLQREYGVQIRIPRLPTSGDVDESVADHITVKATPDRVEKFRQALNQLVIKWDEEKQDRIARSFELEVPMPVDFQARQLISGRRLQFINELMSRHEVFIQIVPGRDSNVSSDAPATEEGKENENGEPLATEEKDKLPVGRPEQQQSRVVIRGYEKNALLARDAIIQRVEHLRQLTSAELTLPHEIHNRLIGVRGRNLLRLIDQYEVDDITFPVHGAVDKDQVIVTGLPDNVDRACDALIDLANDYMDKYEERKFQESAKAPTPAASHANWQQQTAKSPKGFQVTGAPWQQQQVMNGGDRGRKLAPDTNCASEFPTIGGMG